MCSFTMIKASSVSERSLRGDITFSRCRCQPSGSNKDSHRSVSSLNGTRRIDSGCQELGDRGECWMPGSHEIIHFAENDSSDEAILHERFDHPGSSVGRDLPGRLLRTETLQEYAGQQSPRTYRGRFGLVVFKRTRRHRYSSFDGRLRDGVRRHCSVESTHHRCRNNAEEVESIGVCLCQLLVLANRSGSITYETLLKPRSGYQYEIKVTYRDDIQCHSSGNSSEQLRHL